MNRPDAVTKALSHARYAASDCIGAMYLLHYEWDTVHPQSRAFHINKAIEAAEDLLQSLKSEDLKISAEAA